MSVAVLRLHGRSHTAQEHCAQLGLSSAMEDTSLENLCAGGFPGGLGAFMVLGGARSMAVFCCLHCWRQPAVPGAVWWLGLMAPHVASHPKLGARAEPRSRP